MAQATLGGDDQLFAVPKGRAARAVKRGSLPDIGRARVVRHDNQPKLTLASGSLSDLRRIAQSANFGSNRSLTGSLRACSASNLAALSDSNLSLSAAAPLRSYESANTENYLARIVFEQLVKRYYYQLTSGCGRSDCRNKFCKTCKDGVKVSESLAAVLSIELASSNRPYLCVSETFASKPLPEQAFKDSDRDITPFIHRMILTSPFKSFFVDTGTMNMAPPLDDGTCQSGEEISPCDTKIDLNTSILGELPSEIIKYKARRSLTTPNSASLSNLRDLRLATNKATSFVRSSLENIFGATFSSLKKASSSSDVDGIHMTGSTPRLTSANSFNSVTNCRSMGSSPLDVYGSSPLDMYGSNEAMADQLDEFERQLSYEMPAHDMQLLYQHQEFSLSHLSVTMLESAVEKFVETDDPAFLLNTIRTVFTSSEALNKSFKLKEDLPASVNNLDVRGVRRAYKLLSAYFDVLQSPLHNSLEIMLSSMVPHNIQPQHVNQVIIIMEAPVFRKKRNHQLRQKMCTIIACLPAASKFAISQVLSRCDSDTFERKLMGVYKDHFVLSVKPNQRLDGDLVAVADTLAVFFQANQLAAQARGEPIIPVKTFYIPELSRILDFRGEYESWIAKHQGAAGDSSHRSLLDYPFLLDPSCKVHILHLDAVVHMRKEYQEAILHQARINQVRKFCRETNRSLNLTSSIRSAMCPFLVLEIRRSHLLCDTLAEIRLKEADLKKPLKIKYVGGGEQGLDMGGLQKEFFQLICEIVLDPSYGMFTYSEETRMLWINGSTQDLEEFELVGIILGLAIYNGVILDVRFPTVIYKKLQGMTLDLSDLMEAQPTVGRSLEELLNYDEDDVEDVFCLTFQISVDMFGQRKEVELVPKGATIPVTIKNRVEFVNRFVEYTLVDSVAPQFQAFERGFSKVCSTQTLALFQPHEIELLVCGSPDLDFHALQSSVSYDDGFSEDHQVIKAFWSVVHEMSGEHKKMLLHFITGSDRVPLKGLSHLPIVIQRNGTGQSDRLPTAMTCFNRLLLPAYTSADKLKRHLYTAIENGKGFGLT